MTTADPAIRAPHPTQPQSPVEPPDPEPGRAPSPAPTRSRARPWQVACAAVGLGVLFSVGFFVYDYGLSGVSQARAQAGMFKNLVGQLHNGTAPVAPYTLDANGNPVPLAERTPVAILNIPEIGLSNVVVVEGTTSRDLALGPGHVRASALPGQAGVSFIYGKAVTYGAPFAHLMRLNRGDRFTVTTGQGTATYEVESFGASYAPAPADSVNRLVLETAASSWPWAHSAVQVSAGLVSPPQANPGGWPALSPQEKYMQRDTADSLVPLMLWSQALLVAVIAATIGVHLWSRWATYLLTAPVILALLWCVYENLACIQPNLY